MIRVLVTGANGFVGRVLCETLSQAGCSVRAAVRASANFPEACDDVAVVSDIDASTNWSAALRGMDVIVHAAARAHILNDSAENAALYHRTNVEGTRALLCQAKAEGVGRLIFVSTIKVNGEATAADPFRADDAPCPSDDYARSKLAAEEAVLAEVAAGEMDACIVRPPLVYGPRVRANFLRMMQLVDRGIPLPLGSVRNSRSMVSVWNLCDLIALLVRRRTPAHEPRRFLVSDDCDLSTPDLIRRLAVAMNRKPRLLSAPVGLLRAGAWVLGRQHEIARLCGSLELDIAPTQQVLGWQPPVSVDEGLSRTVRWYLETRRDR